MEDGGPVRVSVSVELIIPVEMRGVEIVNRISRALTAQLSGTSAQFVSARITMIQNEQKK